jgi:folate-binding protein YgfZ
MTAPDSTPLPFLLNRGQLAEADAEAVMDGAGFARADWPVVDVSGPGAVTCLQGLLTNDVERPGDGAYVYAAVLTSKGMIQSDLWALRRGGGVVLVIPPDGKSAVDEVLRKTLPPRLARVADRPEAGVWRLVGPQAMDLAARAGLTVPEPGKTSTHVVAGVAVVVARPRAAGPFALELHAESAHGDALAEVLGRAGSRDVGAAGLDLARILAGWPRLGAEIDQKTLPQEVRYDDLDGVSYTKGCYTGQETVARVHFRGHPNRVLAGISWGGGIPDFESEPAITQDGRDVGWVTSTAWAPPIERFIGLAKVRREMDRTRPVVAWGTAARIVPLPFSRDG